MRKAGGVRWTRVFALVAAFVMVSVAFSALTREARAETGSAPTLNAVASAGSVEDGYGSTVTNLSNGALATNYANFRRWDGEWEPYSTLNFSAGNWPYQLAETSTSFTASIGSLSFTQGKIPGATYSIQPDRIEETLQINSSFGAIVASPSVFVPFSTTYFPFISGNTVSLYDYSGKVTWTTAPFAAWDSAKTPHEWANAVVSIQSTPGGLTLLLNTTVTAVAVYPLVIDPTWTLGGSVGWGLSTFANATTDVGDGSVKIGYFADNFNTNQATGWTANSAVTFSGGTMNFAQLGTARHDASWGDQNTEFRIYFSRTSTVPRGITLYFCTSCSLSGGDYELDIEQSGTPGPFVQVLGYSHSNVLAYFSPTMTMNTWYTVRLVARGNHYEVYWNGVQGLSVDDTAAPPGTRTGGEEFSASVSASEVVSIDDFRVWNTNTGTITTPIRNAGTYRPLSTELFGTVDAFNQEHILIRSSPSNSSWGPWTNLKSNAAMSIAYAPANQTQQQYYQLQIVLTTGVNGTSALTQITTAEGTPTISPTTNTGMQPWYPYAGGMVNLVNGNLYATATDISFQGKGFTLAVTRAYNSFLASTSGPFGAGWTFNYGQTLAVNSNGNVTWNGPDGSQFLFIAKSATGGFDSPRGVPDRLLKNSDGTYSLWTTDGGNEKFSSAGLLQTITDRNGNALTMSYSSGKTPVLTRVADTTGKALTFSYDKSNRIISVTDPANRRVTYNYSTSFNGLVTVWDPAMDYTAYDYYQGNYLAGIMDEMGKYTLINYVSGNPPTSGQVGSIWLQYQSSTHWLYWQYRELTVTYNSTTTRAVQDARGYWTSVVLNAFGNPVVIRGPSLGCAACSSSGNTSSYVWDGEMNKVSTTDGRRNTWTMTYGFRGNLLSVSDPGTNVSSESWLEANNATNYFVVPASLTTFRHFSTSYAYDAKGNLISVADSGLNTTRFVYDGFGFLNETIRPRTYPTWYVYNASGWLVKREDALSETTTYAYDGLGRQTSVTDAMGFVASTAYDNDSRVVRTTDALGNFTTYGYDARGDLISVTNPDGMKTAYGYNVTNGEVQTTTDPGNNVTGNAYDCRGNLVSITDADHDTTSYAYDAYDRLTLVTTPLGYVTKYVYDAAGNRVARTDGNGYTTRYAYDRNERLAATMYPGPPVYASPQTLTYAYDADGNTITAAGFGYTETFGYDRSDRLAWVVFNFGTYSTTTKYTYDQDGNKKTMTLGTAATTYFYDKVNRLTGVLDPEGQNTTFGYDKDSRQTTETDPSGVITTSLYDKASRLKAMYTNTSGGAVLESFVYGYDHAGLRTSETDVQNGISTSTTYSYDKNQRLYKVVQGAITTVDTWDAVGNLLSENTETYSYDSDNQLAYVYWSGVLRISYQYDHDGNRLSSYIVGRGPGDTYSYDYENRLLSSSGGASYTYSPMGARVTSTSGTTTTDLAYDSSTGGNVLATYTSSGTQTARYLDSGGLNSPVEVYEGGAHYAYQTDALGSVRMVTGGSQNATDTYAYDAWGNPTSQSGTLANPFEYTGSVFAPDANSNGYFDDRARFYDPSADGGHRFLSADPLGGGYAYAGNSPMNFVDPTGMAKKSGGGGGGGDSGPSPTPKWQSTFCIIEDVLFVIGIALTFLGLYFDEAQLLTWAARIAAAGGLLDVYEIISSLSNGVNLAALAGAVIDFTWALLTQYVIPSINNFWTGLELGAEAAILLTPPGFAAKLVITAAVAAFGFLGLEEEGCGVPR